MQKKVQNYIREHEMIQDGDTIVVAVSGGADSVCLLHLLVAMKEELNISLLVVHIHHGLRDDEADRDASYVEELSAQMKVPCLVVREDVALYAKQNGLSVEEAGRILRYQNLELEAKRLGGAKIAVAHHSQDQAETILYNLFRGSGLKGLGGIAPVRKNIIRPLLGCKRQEIIDYLKEKQISYCEDSSNVSLEYTRNKMRNVIIPMIASEINQGAVEHILHSGEIAAQADAYLCHVAEGILEKQGMHETGSGRIGIKTVALLEQMPVIQSYVILEMIYGICGSKKDITTRHIESIVKLAGKEVGSQIDLPYGMRGRKTYEELWIENKNFTMSVDTLGEKDVPKLEFTVFSYEKHDEIPQNEYTKWFDYDRIKGALSVRFRKTGDFITLKDGSRKTVKAFMIDEKIPRQKRDGIPVLAQENHVLWIVGYRISEYYKVTESTKKILQVKIDGGKDHGR